MITENEVIDTQKSWSDGLLKIVSKHKNNEDYIKETHDFIDNIYDYNNGSVLFKPTLASDSQFRLSKESAVSYFIGNNDKYLEDTGFALKGWDNVIWENAMIKLEGDIAIAMGNYFFLNGSEKLKVEFSFVFKKYDDGIIKILLHDSHLPYAK